MCRILFDRVRIPDGVLESGNEVNILIINYGFLNVFRILKLMTGIYFFVSESNWVFGIRNVALNYSSRYGFRTSYRNKLYEKITSKKKGTESVKGVRNGFSDIVLLVCLTKLIAII